MLVFNVFKNLLKLLWLVKYQTYIKVKKRPATKVKKKHT